MVCNSDFGYNDDGGSGGGGGGGAGWDWGNDNLTREPIIDITYDCQGVLGGSAYEDDCGRCVGGTTGRKPASPPYCNIVPCEGDPVKNPQIQSPGASGKEGGRFRVGEDAVRIRSGAKRPHNGLDISCRLGDPIYPIGSGRVIKSAHQRDVLGVSSGWGRYVDVETVINGQTTYIRYAHLQDYHFMQAGNIYSHQILGYCGKTGFPNDPSIKTHIHIEVSTGCSNGFNQSCRTDPEPYLATKFNSTGTTIYSNPCTQ